MHFALAFNLTAALFAVPVWAVEVPLSGAWRIERAVSAPWADQEKRPQLWEPDRLIGMTVRFGSRAVQGPSPLGCKGPSYATRQDGPDILFQGMLDEAAKRTGGDAAAVARGLGITLPTVLTLDTGCSPVEYHLIKPDALAFGLDNVVYFMRRLKPSAGAPAALP